MLNVTLTPELEELVRQQVASGRYSDASEVIGEALRLMAERDGLAALRAALAVGEEDVARGEFVLYTPQLMEEIKRKATERAAAGYPIDPDVRP